MKNQLSEIRSLMGLIDESYNIENLDILQEQSREDIFRQTKNIHNGDRVLFDKLCDIDPSDDEKRDNKVGSIVPTILNWYKKGMIDNSNFESIRNDLEDYFSVANLNSEVRPTSFKNGKEILYNVQALKTPEGLHEFISHLKQDGHGLENDMVRKGAEYINDGDRKIGTYDGWNIIKLKTKEASNIIGKYTQWCTSRTKLENIPGAGEVDTNEFNDYNNQGDLYVIRKIGDKGKNRKTIFQVFIDKTGTMSEFRDGNNFVVPVDKLAKLTSEKVSMKIESLAQKQKDEFNRQAYSFINDIKNGNIEQHKYRQKQAYFLPSEMTGIFHNYENDKYVVLTTKIDTGIRINGGDGPAVPPHDEFTCIYCKETNSLLKVNGEVYFTGSEITPYDDVVLIGTSGWPGTVWHIVKVNGDVGERVVIAGNDTFSLYKTDIDNLYLTNLPPHGDSSLLRMDPPRVVPLNGEEKFNFTFANPNTYGMCHNNTPIIYNGERMTFGDLLNNLNQ